MKRTSPAAFRRLRRVPSPLFFVSVASKELRVPVNPLDATLMGIFASVADKGLRRIVRVDRLQGLQVRRLGAAPHPLWFL
jgi:hypothetical protein